MLLKRYASIEYILKLSLKQGLKLIEKAQEEDTKEYYYRLWLVRYPLYDEKTYETFEQFYEISKPKLIIKDNRNKDTIMKELLGMESSKKGDESNGAI